MEQETMLKEILHALKIHSEEIEKKFDVLNSKMNNFETRMDNFESRMDNFESRIDNLESTMNNRFDRLEKKVDGIRVELTETQETTDYLLSKNAQHERKLRELSRQP
ncbi:MULTISPECIES: hypothetical protein [Oceanobacillus]|uniref:hypothetical protein n=1 Tax=Oceanobacillus TaxID=182709 RepID=UPI000621251C|nr:hypothetical protein [Oceanobacillus caeni]KKE77947.1 hypothetical protein WH51_15185 [Bacilli bacterium VT-13-104]PZD84022.1 hypothetical protein DEJ64_13170 [Bacilli bacterium]MBU8792033.1 hypothetical protein [Oceanobacillus caeni]MED4475600.1 hypothetical protein [Oceanobacillus caeni]PZD85347.1 hypothetical protein DEJ60_12585 [Bacilli bacterium]